MGGKIRVGDRGEIHQRLVKHSTEMGLKKQHHFVLVHGGGHGAWCWVKIVAVLEKAGHRVTAVDLASAGEDPRSADDITTFEQYNQPLEDLFASFPDHEKVNINSRPKVEPSLPSQTLCII